jgi:hypothetical protein
MAKNKLSPAQMLAGPVSDLRSPDPSVRRKAADVIMRDTMRVVNRDTQEWSRKEDAIAALRAAAGDGDAKVAENAAAALGRLAEMFPVENAGLVPILTGFLGHPGTQARRWAVVGLWRTAGVAIAPTLLPLLDDDEPLVRQAVLGGIATAPALPDETKRLYRGPVHRGLADRDPEVRQGMAGALYVVGDRSSIAALSAALEREKEAFVRESLSDARAYLEKKLAAQ